MNQSTIDIFRYTDEALLFVLRVCINIESSPKTVEQWNLRKLHVLVLKYTSIAVILIYYSSLLLTFNRKPLMWMDLLDIHVHVQCSSRSQACQITLYLSIYNQRIRLNQGIIDLNFKNYRGYNYTNPSHPKARFISVSVGRINWLSKLEAFQKNKKQNQGRSTFMKLNLCFWKLNLYKKGPVIKKKSVKLNF